MKDLTFIVCVLLIISCKKQEVLSIPQEGLIAEILLDGNAVDQINNLVATNHNAVPIADHHGVANKAMNFNQADSAYLDFGDSPAYSFPQNIFTISCWIFIDDTVNTIAILSKRNPVGPFEFSWDNHMNQSSFSFDNWVANGSTTIYGSDPLKATIPIVMHQWQHVAVVADGVVLKAYLNGSEMSGLDSLKSGYSFTDTNAAFQIGVGGGYGKYYYFNGAIDDLLIYGRALTPEEIQMLSEL